MVRRSVYASDRDVFVFLVDDLNPIEAGRLPDGSPDVFFRGFYAWNSEVARDKPHQDVRLDMEAKAKKLMERAA